MKKPRTKKQQRARQLRSHKLKQQLIVILALFGIGAFVMYHAILVSKTFTNNPLKPITQQIQQ